MLMLLLVGWEAMEVKIVLQICETCEETIILECLLIAEDLEDSSLVQSA